MLGRGLASTYILSHGFCGFGVPVKDLTYKGKLYAYRVGSSYFGAIEKRQINIYAEVPIVDKFSVLLELHHKEGGIKKVWWYGIDSDSPLAKVKFELCDKGSAGGSISFAYIDLPIEAEDYFIVRFQGEKIYKGFVTKNVDFSNPTMNLAPFSQRFKELLFSMDYSSAVAFTKDPVEILHDTVIALSAATGISWNPDKVNLGTLDPILAELSEDDGLYHIQYQDDDPAKIQADIVSRGQNRYHGVDLDDEFYVNEDTFANVVNRLYNFEKSWYKEIKPKNNEDDIDATVYKVYKKVQDLSQVHYIGSVGNEGNTTYPPLEISKRLRKIEKKLVVSEVLSVKSALDYAYAKLKQNAKFILSIKVKGININKYRPRIGDWILVEGPWEKLYLDVNKCDDITGWQNATIIQAGLDNGYCIRLFSNPKAISVLDLEYVKQWYLQQGIGCYLKSAIAERTVEIGFSNDLINISYNKVFCRDEDMFDFHQVKYKNEFRYLVFRNTGLSAADLYIDSIQVYCTGKQQYIERISKITYEFVPEGINCDMELGKLTDEESDDVFELERKIRILETISQI